MRVVVTGGAGQLGTLVLRRLAAEPDVDEVVSLDIRPPIAAFEKLRVAIGDVRDPAIEAHFKGADAVVHLAFIVTRAMEATVFEAINVGGSKNVFDRAYAAGVRRFVYASSVAAYGVIDREGVVTEDAPRARDASFAYAACKYDVEAHLDAWEPAHADAEVARIRPSVLVGARIEHNLGRGLNLRVFPDIPRATPVVWDEDVADAFVLALKARARGAFNVCASDSLDGAGMAAAGGFTLLPFPTRAVELLSDGAAWLSARGIGVDPAWLRASFVTHPPFSSDKAKRDLGWAPRCPRAEDVWRRFADLNTGVPDARLLALIALADIKGRSSGHLRSVGETEASVFLEITGHGGGDFTVALGGGRARVRRGAPRPPTSVVTLRVEHLFDLVAGRRDVGTAREEGLIRIEGDAIGGAALEALVSDARGQGRAGVRGAAERALQTWLSR